LNQHLTPERGCGHRVAGGIYAETPLSRDGQPLEHFLVDPPKVVDLNQLGLTAIGVKLIQVNGVWHVFDVVGEAHYPYPADFIEETRCKGASRRLPRNLEFSKLTSKSRLVLVHHKAVLQNYSEYLQPLLLECPKLLSAHSEAPLPETCAGLWWHDLPASAGEPLADGRILRKLAGGVQYRVQPRLQAILPQYAHGIFLILPISNLAVIRGRNAEEEIVAQQSFQVARLSGLPIHLEEA
jgi:hypothetical protein